MLRFLLWRILGLAALIVAIGLIAWLLDGGLLVALRSAGSGGGARHLSLASLTTVLRAVAGVAWRWTPGGIAWWRSLLGLGLLVGAPVGAARLRARHRRRYVRLRVQAYRADSASAEAVVSMYEALHKRLQRRWWRRLLAGQPSVSLEVHHARGTVWLAVACPVGHQDMVQAALRSAYPNCRLTDDEPQLLGVPPTILRLKKRSEFIARVKTIGLYEHERKPAMNKLMTVLDACGSDAFVQLALIPAPAWFERHAKRLYKRHEARLSRERREGLRVRDRSLIEDSELRGGLEVQHRPLFFADLRVIAAGRKQGERIASELRASEQENRLIERGTAIRHGLFGLYTRRVIRGEGNPLPSWQRGVYASTELAAIWHLPSVDYTTVPFARAVLPVAPAPPAILRPADGVGTLRDSHGVVSIHPQMRRQNTAVPGTVEQGKSSYLVATVAEDLRRERCAIIVLDPKGDAAEAAVSLVPAERTCTLLDLAHPTCGFNPLAVDAPADVIADYVVAALKNLFTDADIRASSDRYLRNAIIAVLAHDRSSTLWDAARLLSVGEEGYAYRARVGARVRTLPEYKEISEFFTAELTAQLADSRSTTTAKLDAPVNKLARLLNSSSIKRVLLNDSLRVDFDHVIAGCEVLVVKGALGVMGAGNTSVLMQLLVGMLDAALARQQDLVAPERRIAVALKVDEAPLVLNRGFAETMALKRSAGLETVACWQTESQWLEREVRDQLDALFAHRVYFATASTRDARTGASLMMTEFSDTVRPDVERLSALGHPDARLRLPRHHAIASWSTPEGRQAPFVAETIPMRVDRERLELHCTRQAERGGRYREDLSQPHWDRARQGHAAGSKGRGSSEAAALEAHAQARARVQTPAHVQTRTQAQAGGAQNLERASRPSAPADSYRELVELDGAHSVRWARPVQAPRSLRADAIDLEMLTLIAGMRHVLTSQLHRRFNTARAMTTTQRRLKRLSDAGLVRRFQFHRRDGGGVPMCYAIAPSGLELLHAHERLTELQVQDIDRLFNPAPAPATAPVDGERRLRQACHDVHVAGWALALERAAGQRMLRIRGAAESILSVPLRSSATGRVALGPDDLTLPGGRVPHEFLRTEGEGVRMPVQRFETVRPDATIELPADVEIASSHRSPEQRGTGAVQAIGSTGSPMETRAGAGLGIDVLVELDDRLPTGRAAAKLERYDHFLAGWSLHVSRYGNGRAVPAVVFVCRDRARARDCARAADATLGACRAYAGEYPADWEYPGRERILFVAERDVHEGLLSAYGVPRLPPEVRISLAHGDLRAGEAAVQTRTLIAVTLSREGESHARG
jgi:hypothetical protein